MSARMFGTDGVRGIANRDLDCQLAFEIGQAGAQVLTERSENPIIIVGTDTRLSCDMLSSALMAGICSVGASVEYVGVVPTPGVAYITANTDAAAGVVVSASHNSFEYNGIKWFSAAGYKLTDETEDSIESVILSNSNLNLPVGSGLGRIEKHKKHIDDYIAYLVSNGQDYSGIKIVLDCANGAASAIAPQVFTELGAEVAANFCTPDGININKNCGSTYPEELQKLVKEQGADIGLAFDGDADRLIAVDSSGEVVDGDKIMAICALELKRLDKLSKYTLVTTVMSNLGMKNYIKHNGIRITETDVGDRYVLKSMLENGYSLGGEQSGHMIFGDKSTTGDGVLSAIMLLNAIVNSKKNLHDIAKEIPIYPQVLINIRVDDRAKSTTLKDDSVLSLIKKNETELGETGRILVRASGTEPLIRVMVEGANNNEIYVRGHAIAKAIAEVSGGEVL